MTEPIVTCLCHDCNTHYPLTGEYFHRNARDKSGYNNRCKECAKFRARKWHANNRKYANERSREYYQQNPDKVRQYRNENAEEIAATKRAWRKSNPDKVKKHRLFGFSG